METVTFFKRYQFKAGEKIHIEDGPRSGDWEVIGFTERKVELRCPVSGHVVEWDRFCYYSETKNNESWPKD